MNETQTYTLNRPVPFTGTPAEAAANMDTHMWFCYGDEVECDRCLAKPWHTTAAYPCGTNVPRETVEVTRTVTETTTTRGSYDGLAPANPTVGHVHYFGTAAATWNGTAWVPVTA
jgi:hypothetical protein